MKRQWHKQHTRSQHIAFLLTVTVICSQAQSFRALFIFQMHAPTRKRSVSADTNQVPESELPILSVCFAVGCQLRGALSARPFLDKTNSHTSSRLRLTLWCRWPSLTPFVSLPASDVAICLFLYYQSWPAPLQLLPPSQPHNGPLRQTTHTHIHKHIYTPSMTHTQGGYLALTCWW